MRVIFLLLLSLLPYLSKASATPLLIQRGPIPNSYDFKVKVELDGLIRSFLLDLGSTATMIVSDSELSKYSPIGSTTGQGANGSTMGCDLIETRKVSLGSFYREKFLVRRCNLDESSGDVSSLGLDFFKDQIFFLSTKRRTLRFLNRNEMGPNWNFRELHRLSSGHLAIDVSVVGQQLRALFDTGEQMSAVDLEFAKSHPQLFKPIKLNTDGKDAFGNVIPLQFFEVERIEIGGVSFKKLHFTSYPFRYVGTYAGDDVPLKLGANAVVRADWLLDLQKNQWAVRAH